MKLVPATNKPIEKYEFQEVESRQNRGDIKKIKQTFNQDSIRLIFLRKNGTEIGIVLLMDRTKRFARPQKKPTVQLTSREEGSRNQSFSHLPGTLCRRY
jgi:hypothetical protein